MRASSPYLAFWQIKAPVFLGPVTSESAFLSREISLLIERVQTFCNQGSGLIIITGPRGSGRSTLLRWLFENTDTDFSEPLIMTLLKEETETGWLLPRLQAVLGLPARRKTQTFEELFHLVTQKCQRFLRGGRGLVIMIDGGELIRSVAALGEVVSLLNIQGTGHFRTVVVIAGTEQTGELCRKSTALNPRILSHLHVDGLSADEIAVYIAYRCQNVGLCPTPFDATAIAALHSMSGGVLARVNALAENALIEASGQRRTSIDQDLIVAAGRFLDLGLTPSANLSGRDALAGKQIPSAPLGPPGAKQPEPLAALFRLDPSLSKSRKKDDGSTQ